MSGADGVPGAADPAHVTVVVVGAGLLGLAVWGWAGRSPASRWWVGRPLGSELVLAVLPGLGLIVLGGGVLSLFGSSAALAVVVPMLFGAVLALAGMLALLPRWWGPRWYRELPKNRQRRDTRRSSLAAAMVGFTGRPGVVSAREAAVKFGRATPVASWRGGWVYDPDADERAHGMSRRGTVDGRLTLYPNGVVFAASVAEDVLRGQGTVLAVSGEDITEVRVVPPRAGADGRQRRGRLYRSWFPRLVIDTSDGAHVFDVAWGRADQVADRVRTLSRA